MTPCAAVTHKKNDLQVPLVGNMCGPNASVPDAPCPSGFYCPDPGTQLLCPAGYYCPMGTAAPLSCNRVAQCAPGTGRPQAYVFGVIISFAMLLLYFITAAAIGAAPLEGKSRRNSRGATTAIRT